MINRRSFGIVVTALTVLGIAIGLVTAPVVRGLRRRTDYSCLQISHAAELFYVRQLASPTMRPDQWSYLDVEDFVPTSERTRLIAFGAADIPLLCVQDLGTRLAECVGSDGRLLDFCHTVTTFSRP